MAYFAKIEENNLVSQVIIVDDLNCDYKNFPESEAAGIEFLSSLQIDGVWKQTSENGSYRKNFASIGYRYDSVNDWFIPPKPFNSWILDELTCQWFAPVEKPNDGNVYLWDEENNKWSLLDSQ